MIFKQNIQLNKADILRKGIFLFLTILIFYPPYARGLFFTKELLPFHVMSFGLFLVFILYKFVTKNYRIFKAPIDYAAAGLVGAYFLPIIFFQTAHLRDAIAELLKYINYFVIYVMIRDIVKSKKELFILLHIMLVSAVGMAIIGIDAVAGEGIARLLEKVVSILPGVDYSVFGTLTGVRINSMMQYANTLAVYLLAAFMLSNGLLLYVKNKYIKHIYAGISFILLLTFIFTYSRGAWLLLPMVYLVFLIMLGKVHSVIASFFYVAVTGIVVLVSIPFFNRHLESDNILGVWAVTLGGAITAILLSFIVGLLIGRIKTISSRRILTGGIIGIALLGGIAASLLIVVLSIEAPLKFINESENNSWRQVDKVIDGIQGDNSYTFRYVANTVASEENESHWAYIINISSINTINEHQHIIEINDLVLEEEMITFNTLPDTEKINIRIIHFHAKTAVSIQNATLINNKTGEQQRVLFRYKYIPDALVRRFNDINTNDYSVNERVVFYKDSIKIIKDYPIIGAGGGAWSALYFMYQSYMYWSTQTHNYFMQLWIEAGIVGLLMLTAFIALFFCALYRYLTKGSKQEHDIFLIAALIAGVVALLLHSAMDFNFTLAAVALMLWQFIAITIVIVDGRRIKKKNALKDPLHKYVLIVITGIGIIVFSFSISLQSGFLNGEKGLQCIRGQEIEQAIEHFERATRRDPFTASYHMDLGKLYQDSSMIESQGKRHVIDREHFDKAQQMVKRALTLEPYNSQLYAHAASFMMSRGEVDKSLAYIEKSIQVQPLRTENYQQKAQTYFTLAVTHLNAQRYEEGEMKLKEILEIPIVIREVNKTIEKPIWLNDKTVEIMEKADYLLKYYKEEDGIKSFNRMIFSAYFGGDTTERGLPDAWWTSHNKPVKLQSIITENQTLLLKNVRAGQGTVESRRFNLQENTRYQIQVTVKGKIENNSSLDIYVLSSQGKHVQLHVSQVNIEQRWNQYEYTFITAADIKEGQQYVRFVFKGSGNEYVEIADIKIYQGIGD